MQISLNREESAEQTPSHEAAERTEQRCDAVHPGAHVLVERVHLKVDEVWRHGWVEHFDKNLRERMEALRLDVAGVGVCEHRQHEVRLKVERQPAIVQCKRIN